MEDALEAQEVFGRRMAILRKSLGLSQAQLAEAISSVGLRWLRETVVQIESGKRGVSLAEAAAVAAFFEMPPVELIAAPIPDSSEVILGNQVLDRDEWLNLWADWPYQKEPPGPRKRAAIDRLFKPLKRPWASFWRRRGGPPGKAFLDAREKVLSERTKFPGPIFVSDEDYTRTQAFGPFGAQLVITLKAGEPYVARDEAEAAALLDAEENGQVRRVPRHVAQYMRDKKKVR